MQHRAQSRSRLLRNKHVSSTTFSISRKIHYLEKLETKSINFLHQTKIQTLLNIFPITLFTKPKIPLTASPAKRNQRESSMCLDQVLIFSTKLHWKKESRYTSRKDSMKRALMFQDQEHMNLAEFLLLFQSILPKLKKWKETLFMMKSQDVELL